MVRWNLLESCCGMARVWRSPSFPSVDSFKYFFDSWLSWNQNMTHVRTWNSIDYNLYLIWVPYVLLLSTFIWLLWWYYVLPTLHTRYVFRTDPRSFGGCVSCPQVPTYRLEVLQLRISIAAFDELHYSGATFGISCYYFDTSDILWYGYDGCPVPSFDFMYSF